MSDPITKLPDGGPAFPQYPDMILGMSLRDYFAAAALTGLLLRISNETVNALNGNEMTTREEVFAALAYCQSDAMLYQSQLVPTPPQSLQKACHEHFDAMLAERDKGK